MRDDFSEQDKRTLAARAGHRCSRPECYAATSGPQIQRGKTVNVGVAAHISAASPGGPRHDPLLSSNERAALANGIWLCQTCAKLVDNDAQRFPSNLLSRWKAEAEKAASDCVGKAAAGGWRSSHASSAASSSFIAAFAEALGGISSGNGDPFHLLASDRKKHDAAIVAFRYALAPNACAAFDEAVSAFRAARDGARPAIIQFYELQATGRASGTTANDLVRTIEQLLDFAQKIR